jgi:ribosomal protein L21E
MDRKWRLGVNKLNKWIVFASQVQQQSHVDYMSFARDGMIDPRFHGKVGTGSLDRFIPSILMNRVGALVI